MSKPPSPPTTKRQRNAVQLPTLLDHIGSLTEEMLVLLEDVCSVDRPLSPAEAEIERAIARIVKQESKRRKNKSRAGVGSTRTANRVQTAR